MRAGLRSPLGRKKVAHGVSRWVCGQVGFSPWKGRKNIAFISSAGERVRADLTPPSGGSRAVRTEPTACAVGYFLSPFGLAALRDPGARPVLAEVVR